MELKNKRFGKIVCLEPASKKRYWLCKCDCGNEKEIRDNHLSLGLTKTCGECPIFELTGKKIGKLTVIEYIPEEPKSGKSRRFRCKCDCGKETITQSSSLLNSTHRSCGQCVDTQWKIGEKFGYLRVLEYHGRKGMSSTEWKCQCDCGSIKIVDRNNLVTGNVQSCGCKRFIEGSMQGERGNVNILKEEDVIKIRKIWAEELITRKATGESKANYSMQDIADIYHVSYGCIFKVVNSRTWFFLPPVQRYIEEFKTQK